MINAAEKLAAAVPAVCPIVGVSIGVISDKSTWRIDYDPSATDAQKQAAQNVVASFDPHAPTKADYSAATQVHIDATAQQKGYNDGVSCASYATSTNTQWKAEATAFISWRDSVWSAAYSTLAQVQAGQIAQPTVSDFVASLPAITWA